MPISVLLLGIFSSLLLAAALFDLVSYTIPNRLIGAICALFILFLLSLALRGHAMSWANLQLHLLAGTIALAAGIGLFAPGWIGGGDAKLFAVICLWLGWRTMLDYALVASLMGGALTLGILTLRRIPLHAAVATQPWLLKLTDRDSGIPYGVALSLAAFFVLPGTELFRLAVN